MINPVFPDSGELVGGFIGFLHVELSFPIARRFRGCARLAARAFTGQTVIITNSNMAGHVFFLSVWGFVKIFIRFHLEEQGRTVV